MSPCLSGFTQHWDSIGSAAVLVCCAYRKNVLCRSCTFLFWCETNVYVQYIWAYCVCALGMQRYTLLCRSVRCAPIRLNTHRYYDISSSYHFHNLLIALQTAHTLDIQIHRTSLEPISTLYANRSWRKEEKLKTNILSASTWRWGVRARQGEAHFYEKNLLCGNIQWIQCSIRWQE